MFSVIGINGKQVEEPWFAMSANQNDLELPSTRLPPALFLEPIKSKQFKRLQNISKRALELK